MKPPKKPFKPVSLDILLKALQRAYRRPVAGGYLWRREIEQRDVAMPQLHQVRDGDLDIYVTSLDGSELYQITNDPLASTMVTPTDDARQALAEGAALAPRGRVRPR